MTNVYHESTGNTIYQSDNKLFSSSNARRVDEFEKLNINSKYDFEDTAQANQMLNWGYLPIAEAFLDEYYHIMTYFNTYYKKDVEKLDVKVSMRTNVKETTQMIYKEIFDKFIEKGYTKCKVYKTGINTYTIGFDSLRKLAEKQPYGYELIYSLD